VHYSYTREYSIVTWCNAWQINIDTPNTSELIVTGGLSRHVTNQYLSREN